MPGMIFRSKSSRIAAIGSPSRGADDGNDARMSPGFTCESTGNCSGFSRYCPIQSRAARPCSLSSSRERSPFIRSTPPEDAKGDEITDDHPPEENRELWPQSRESNATQHARAQGVVRRGERQCFDNRLHRARKVLRRKEDARQNPHWQHREIH